MRGTRTLRRPPEPEIVAAFSKRGAPRPSLTLSELLVDWRTSMQSDWNQEVINCLAKDFHLGLSTGKWIDPSFANSQFDLDMLEELLCSKLEQTRRSWRMLYMPWHEHPDLPEDERRLLMDRKYDRHKKIKFEDLRCKNLWSLETGDTKNYRIWRPKVKGKLIPIVF